MSYPRQLDEYTDAEIRDEWRRRRACRKQGLCYYCGKPLIASTRCAHVDHVEVRKVPLEVAEVVRERLGREIVDELPDGWRFLLMIASEGAGGFCTYTSNIERSSAIDVLLELVSNLRSGKKTV